MKAIRTQTLVTKPVVKITHGQSVKLSRDWNSADAHYSISREVDDNPEAIKAGFTKLEKTVEKRLSRKMIQQGVLLKSLARTDEED